MDTAEKLILNELLLQNFATFEDQSINFTQGFNAIVGETGSGKSLILDALQMILGARADKKLVRKGCDFSTIEAVFSCNDDKIRQFFNEEGYPFEGDEILIKRILYSSGKTKSFLNFQTCSLQILQKFSKRFTDLVGQFENQKLLSEKYQMVLLDNFAKNEGARLKFEKAYIQLIDTNKKIEELKSKRVDHAGRLDYINFQLEELDTLSPSIKDEEDLLKQKQVIMNLEVRSKFISNVDSIFDDGLGLNSILSTLEKEILGAASFIQQDLLDSFSNAKETLNDLQYKISSFSNDDISEVELDSVIEKLDSYQRLKRKFSTDTEGLLKISEDLRSEKDTLNNISDNLQSLEELSFSLNQKALKLALGLHDTRIQAAKNLSSDLTKAIRSLRMKGSTIKIEMLKNVTLTNNGVSQINFLAETNPGEGYYKVKDAASGGELSRILLAIRQILSAQDTINIFLFDEIDTGIGGETALKIGEALQKVSTNSQVIAITHLPQIAKFSNKLVMVSKGVKSSRTYSKVDELIGERIQEEVIHMNPLN
jgi:DNA repair protein RecN (Recombination protein N)